MHLRVECLLALLLGAFAPVATAQPALQAELAAGKQRLQRILFENILPFWYPAVLDTETGGYRLNHDIKGRWRGPAAKRLVVQARTVWFFSRLVNAGYGTQEHLKAAEHGYRFLRRRMWDEENGGFYWEVDTNGENATMPDKHLYGQAFGLYALSEFAIASGDSGAADLARELFSLLEFHAHDSKYGGYIESFRPDWSALPTDSRNYMGVPPSVKLMNTHLHLLEAVTAYYRATKDPVARERLVELVLVESNSVVRKNIGACTDKYRPDWTPLREPRYDRVSYGHDVENIWLLVEACDAAGFPQGPLLDLYRTLFDYSLRYGYDDENGGFFDTGPFNAPADSRSKTWWVQAEGLVSTLSMYQLTREQVYLDCFLKTLDWIEKRQADWENGDWFAQISEDGNPSGGKAGPWKSPYHNGRAMIECLERIDLILKE